MNMHAVNLIAAIGGKRLREACNASPSAIGNWRREGIPARYWFIVDKLIKDVDGVPPRDQRKKAFTFAGV